MPQVEAIQQLHGDVGGGEARVQGIESEVILGADDSVEVAEGREDFR